ncbi:facilitated trehalose transporter Tret1-like [Neocloeon triangulifer]|uniref:facilitated trehalose transporter Tret1-like n=1 Tax=Neocloeon triangulifer TaxID=2078957 RepID=UPI00286F741A|nr:facilitated trehalose transporter Tret1-like [Neocloeon triangulifer]XP_059472406.1 facilitated trehalose transporter Tret1-like [Neocloeon triangulifer]
MMSSMENIVRGEVVDEAASVDHGGTDNPALAAEIANEPVMPKKPEFTDEELSSMVAYKPSGPPQPPVSKLRQAAPQVLATMAKNLLLLAYGMTIGFPTIVIPTLTNGDEPNLQLTTEQISWFSSINLICVPVGGLLSGALTNFLGRKKAMMLVNLPILSAWLMLRYTQNVPLLYFSLALTGFTGGLLEAPVLTYVAEITTPEMRGMLASTSSMSIIAGTFIQFLLATVLSWRDIAAYNIIAPVTAFCCLFLVPDSPYWLATKGRVAEAHKSLAWLRGWVTQEAVQDEFNYLLETVKTPKMVSVHKDGHITRMEIFKHNLKPYTRATFVKPFILVSSAFFFGHFSGMTTLQTYSVSIFEQLGAPIDPFQATMLLGLVQLTGTLLCVVVVHWSGKRPLTLISTVGAATCFGITATYDMVRQSDPTVTASWVPLTFLLSSAFLTHMGIRLLPWILIGEVFPADVRGMASGAASSVGYIFGFLANKTHFSLVEALTLAGTFWIYVCVSLVATVLLYIFMPETEGRTLLEISRHFAGEKVPGWKRRRPRKSTKQSNELDTTEDDVEASPKINQNIKSVNGDTHL